MFGSLQGGADKKLDYFDQVNNVSIFNKISWKINKNEEIQPTAQLIVY